MHLYFVLLVFGSAAAHSGGNFTRIDCEPGIQIQRKTYWADKYKLSKINDNVGFVASYIYSSKYKDSGRWRSWTALSMYETAIPARWVHIHNSLVLLSFVRGDAVEVHKIHHTTGEYSVVELGFHTNKFFTTMTEEYFFVIDAKQHLTKDHILVLYSSVNRDEEQVYVFPGHADMITRFPHLADVIVKYAPINSTNAY